MSFDPNHYLNQRVAAVPKSGIRKFFDVAATIPGAISLGVGEPDFVTPYHIRNAAINSILDGAALDPYSGFPAYRSACCNVRRK